LPKNVDGFWIGHIQIDGIHFILYVQHIPGNIFKNYNQIDSDSSTIENTL